jgi:hypothetical protein
MYTQFHPRSPKVTQASAEGRKDFKPRGAKTAAPQSVIVSERWNREPNDLNQAEPVRFGHLPIAICLFSKIGATPPLRAGERIAHFSGRCNSERWSACPFLVGLVAPPPSRCKTLFPLMIVDRRRPRLQNYWFTATLKLIAICQLLFAESPLLALLYDFAQIRNRPYLNRSKSILKARKP